MKVQDLAPNPKNPRTITPEKLQALKKAVHEFGDLSGVVFNRKSKQLVGGHRRTEIMDKASAIEIVRKYSKPTRTGTVAEGYILVHGERHAYREVLWDRPREIAANLAANKGAGAWDLPQVAEWLKELGSFDVDFDLSLTMFDADELKEFAGITVKEHTRVGPTGVDEDAIPEKPPARTQPGSIYQLGDHRLICGDARNLETARAIVDSPAAMVWTDPPYNVALGMETPAQAKARNRRTDGKVVVNDKMDDAVFREFLSQAFATMFAFCRPGGAIYVSHADSEGYNFRGAMRDSGWLTKQCLIWKKSSLVMGRQDFHWIHEPILYGWKPGSAHYWYNDRKQTTVLEFAKPSRSSDHPTMKPVELVEYCIGNNSKPEEVVFDPFGGSGTTLIACEKLGRACRTIEIDPHYCDVIVERWEKYTGQKAKLLNPFKMPTVTKLRKKAPAKQGSSRAQARA